jgi:hypothetical protein
MPTVNHIMQPQISEILATLATLTSARTKKHYVSQGVREPMFGVPVGVLKPIAKPLIGNQALAEGLYATGNYDAMYLAGMIADVDAMQPADFWRWIGRADCYMLSDFVVAVTLAETDFAQTVADEFINDPGEFVQSGGWSCYEWLLGSRKDHEFDPAHIQQLLYMVETTIAHKPLVTQHAMIRFVVAVGVSYLPLHAQALHTATIVNQLLAPTPTKKPTYADPLVNITQAINKNRIGFKRRHVRC